VSDQSENTKFWYEVVIDDAARCLPGKSILEVISLILASNDIKYVITNDIEGGMVPYFQEIEHIPTEISDVLPKFINVVQFDWGDFFLYKNYPRDWKFPEDKNTRIEEYHQLIQETDVTVRAVDDRYMYVYTKDKKIVKVIADNYVTESIKFAPIESLSFPC
jgi:hypothetical protein